MSGWVGDRVVERLVVVWLGVWLAWKVGWVGG